MTCSITFALFEFKVTYIVLSSEQAENIWYLDCCVSLPGDSSLMSVAASLPWCGASRDIWWGAGGWHLWWDKGHHSPLQLTLTSVITKPRISWLTLIEEGDTSDFRPPRVPVSPALSDNCWAMSGVGQCSSHHRVFSAPGADNMRLIDRF